MLKEPEDKMVKIFIHRAYSSAVSSSSFLAVLVHSSTALGNEFMQGF